MVKMLTLVDLFLIRIEKQGIECICFILLMKKIFGKHFNVFYTSTEAAVYIAKIFSL